MTARTTGDDSGMDYRRLYRSVQDDKGRSLPPAGLRFTHPETHRPEHERDDDFEQLPDGDPSNASAWREAFLAPDEPRWIVAVRFVYGPGGARVGELRVFPNEAYRPATGQWSGDNYSVPDAGVTRRLLRRLILPASETGFLIEQLDKDWHRLSRLREQRLERETRQFDRREHQRVRMAEALHVYVDAVNRRDRQPVQAVAQSLGIRPSAARDLIRSARESGLLEYAAMRGVAGGRLTEAGVALLREVLDNDQN